jgi:FHS family L-fucose permease-like MFS transporter
LVTVFFFWGFIAAGNSIFIPFCKHYFALDQFQSQLIDFAFYTAYYIGALALFAYGSLGGKELVGKWGYKKSIVYGLLFSALGAVAMIIAVNANAFSGMLVGLFIVALGFSLQQTAANPLAIIMGDPKKGSQRLSMAGGINNFGTTIGPLLVSFAIFGTVAAGTKGVASIESIKTPYLILGAAFLVVALIFRFSSIPNKIDLEQIAVEEAEGKEEKVLHRKSPFQYSQLVLGMVAIFVYVGVEVSTASNLPEFMKQHLKGADGQPFPTDQIAPYVSLFWASLMIGRWTGSVGAFDVSAGAKKILQFLMPYL